MLKGLGLNFSYTSEDNDLFEEFFVPALSNSVEYKRAVGYFSLGVLLNTPSAISQIVENGGKIKILFGQLVSETDFEAIKSGLSYSFPENIVPDFQEILARADNSLLTYRVRLLAYLFSMGQLEIKVAFRKHGLFHQKIGILIDRDSNIVSFNGSMNETESALNPELNSEEITVFKSWNSGQRDYVRNHCENFDKLWSNTSSSATYVCDLPEVISENLNIISRQASFVPSVDQERNLIAEFLQRADARSRTTPRVPTHLFDRVFKMREHQIDALRSWKGNGFNGILELATGTGKTITSIFAATTIAEQNAGISLIVSVPYVSLADQWCEELRLFNIHALKCYGAREDWYPKLSSYCERNDTNQDEFIAIVVVNKTLKSESFQKQINKFDMDRTFFIGDECHHHGSMGFSEKIPVEARFKLGLSATPFHYTDEEANTRLKLIYGDIVYSYSLYQAIENGILTPYDYYPIPVELTAEEADEYYDITDKIGKMIATISSSNGDKNERLQSLLMRRARLVGTAKNKLIELQKLISQRPVPSHSLFYCSDGSSAEEDEDAVDNSDTPTENEVKQRTLVGRILRSKGVTASPFTATETQSQRKEILNMFKGGDIKSLIAIKCLDEGIDVPACSTAYILASSRNPRQFIQRRGRILRKSEGKEKATIYDFVAVLPSNAIETNTRDVEFFKNELARVADFARHSNNPLTSLRPLHALLKKYDLFHLVV